MALTKAQIIEEISSRNGFARKKTAEVYNSLLEILKSTLVSGEDVMISGFGKFCVKQKKQRKGRNPATGEDLTLRPRQVVTFKCSGMLRKQVNRR